MILHFCTSFASFAATGAGAVQDLVVDSVVEPGAKDRNAAGEEDIHNGFL